MPAEKGVAAMVLQGDIGNSSAGTVVMWRMVVRSLGLRRAMRTHKIEYLCAFIKKQQ